MDLSLWKLAMIALLPLICMQRGRLPVHKLRVWGALFGASVAAWIVTPAVGHVPLLWYIVIDTAAAWIVLARPAGLAQKLIGLLFAAMVLFHVGVLMRGAANVNDTYFAFQLSAGWAQLLVLAGWSGNDVGRSVWRRLGGGVPVPAAQPDHGASR
jgi:hypothetical protein